MSGYYDTQQMSPPIFPNGSNSLEARTKAIEIHLWHMSQGHHNTHAELAALRAQMSAIDARHMSQIRDQEQKTQTLVRNVGLKLIGLFATATGVLAIMVLKSLFPGLI